MAVISIAEVQQFLEPTRFTVTNAEVTGEFELSARTEAFARVSSAYATTSWITEGTTPKLVRLAIAMLVAARLYARAYSEEDTEGNAYARRLEKKAYDLLDGIADGTIDLEEVAGEVGARGGPGFWPDDSTESDNVIYDGEGGRTLLSNSSARRFEMGTIF